MRATSVPRHFLYPDVCRGIDTTSPRNVKMSESTPSVNAGRGRAKSSYTSTIRL